MKVDNPKFYMGRGSDEVRCKQCPLEGQQDLCAPWLKYHSWRCPTKETYAEACHAAEGGNK